MKHTLLIIPALMLIVGCSSPEPAGGDKQTNTTQSKPTPVKETPPVGMIFVEGGTFEMGSNSGDRDEKPVHSVTVSGFFMDRTEVTQAEYRKVMGENPSYSIGENQSYRYGKRWGDENPSYYIGCDDCPVEDVSWYDANAYAHKVGKRLPTEAEWEYAARGGNKSKGYEYSGSNDIDDVGLRGTSDDKTPPVAQKMPNELGLYDMSGNVWEWCSDWYGEYSSSPQTDPQGPNSGEECVLRGGEVHNDGGCRVADRYGDGPDGRRYNGYGFRLVLSQDL